MELLEAYRPQVKDIDSLETLITTYLSDRRAYLPNYKARRAQHQHIGGAHTEWRVGLVLEGAASAAVGCPKGDLINPF